ncbi:MAG: NTE family protein [Candidatus Marinamargulisbacteria bacterium]|jgi:NTE family protein
MFFKKRPKKVGLALGGGAARGVAHIGVLKAFSENNIPIDMIAGTSSGAFVGGIFASGMEIDAMIAYAEHLSWRQFAKFKLSRKGLFSGQPMEDMIRGQVGHIKFKDLKVPFSALATDLLSGEGVVLNDPELEVAQAIRASTSFPGVFTPTIINGRSYIDGGAAFNIPIPLLKGMGADVIVAVDVIPEVSLQVAPRNVATLVDRGLDLLLNTASKETLKEADIVLKPIRERIDSFSVKRGPHLIELGEKAVYEQLDIIKKLVS